MIDANTIDDFWRGKLEDAQRRFSADPNIETHAEFRRLLCRFADLNDLVTSAKSQTMAPAVGPEMRPGESAFSMIGRNVEET